MRLPSHECEGYRYASMGGGITHCPICGAKLPRRRKNAAARRLEAQNKRIIEARQ